MGSQKADALQKYKYLKDEYAFSYAYRTLDMFRIDILEEGVDTNDVDWATIREGVIKRVDEYNNSVSNNSPVFVRACPLVPRPGVLESSKATSFQQMREIVLRIYDKMVSIDDSPKPMYDCGLIDPYGSIIIMPYVDANASAVTSLGHYIYMGEGNDGITAGGDCFKMAVPLIPAGLCRVSRDLERHDFKPDKLELEFVVKGDTNQRQYHPDLRGYLVQLRGCEGARPIAPPPKGVNISGTFHGEGRIIVENVFLCADDSEEELSKLEDALRQGMPQGTVVIHPTGCHLTHHAGQCMKYNVPYIASANVNVGEQWTQASAGWVVLDPDGTYEPQPYDMTEHIDAFIQGLNSQTFGYARQHGWLSNMFHQFTGGPINDPHDTAVLAGAFVGWLAKATLSVGMGETRHIPTHTHDASPLVQTAIASIFKGRNIISEHVGLSTHRGDYYADIENCPMSWESVRDLFMITLDGYSKDVSWSTSYGGAKYRKSLQMGLNTTQAILKLLRNPTAKNLKNLCDKANANEHATHNTNFFFSKFLSKSALDWGTKKLQLDSSLEPFNMFFAGLDVMNRVNANDTYKTTSFDTRVKKVLKEYSETSYSSLRLNPLGAQTKGLLAEGFQNLEDNQRHPRGKYSRPYDVHSFIPCGVKGCEMCEGHLTYVKEHLLQGITSKIPITESFVFSFPVKLIGEAKHLEAITHLTNVLSAWKSIHTSLTTPEIHNSIHEIKKLSSSIPKDVMASNEMLVSLYAYFFGSLDSELLMYYNTYGEE